MTEAQLQAAVVDLAKWSGFLVFHVIDSRKSTGPGFPDLVMVHRTTGRVVWAELKAEKGRTTPKQDEWLDALALQSEVYLWRPADLTSGAITRILEEPRRAVA